MTKNHNSFPIDNGKIRQEIFENIYDPEIPKVAHGSQWVDLKDLQPGVSSRLAVHTATGTPYDRESVVYGTQNPDAAIFYATVHGVASEFWLPEDNPDEPGRQLDRASGVQAVRDEEDHIIGWRYFASDATKELVQRRIDEGTESKVYFGAQTDFEPVHHGADWAARGAVRILGSTAVTALHFRPDDIFNLPSPDSDEQISRFYDEAGMPPETKSLVDARRVQP